LIEIKLSVFLITCGMSPYNDRQRAGLYAGWELVFRLPITAAY